MVTENHKRLHGRDKTVAGGIKFREYNVSRLLTAKGVSVRLHFFQHVAVAYIGRHGTASVFRQRLAEAQVAHDGAYDHIRIEPPFFLHTQGVNHHEMVAIHDISLFINEKTAVRIAVISNTTVRPHFDDHFLQGFHVGGTAVFIDIHAVRFAVEGGYFRTQFTEDVGKESAGGAVGGIRYDFHPFEIPFHCGKDIIFIFPRKLVAVADKSDLFAGRPCQFFVMSKDIFYFFFRLIWQFMSVPVKKFDSVIGERVMGSRYNDTGIIVFCPCQVCDTRCRNHACQVHIHP